MPLPYRDTPSRYGAISMLLHWSVAAAVIAMLAWGWWMTGLPLSMEKLWAYNLHKAVGMVILAVTTFRLAWRLASPGPQRIAMPAWQRFAATASHAALYCCLFTMPLLGWLGSSASGLRVRPFGLVDLPLIAPADERLAALAFTAHVAMSWVLAALIVLHVAAALTHHFVDRDATLRRMLPLRGASWRGRGGD